MEKTMTKKFSGMQNPYGTIIQSKAEAEQPSQSKQAKEYYRFNLKLPIECKDYLQQMAWKTETTVTEYLSNLVLQDMAQHPEWREDLDELNQVREKIKNK